MVKTRYFIDEAGKYLGGFAGAEPPVGAKEIDAPPRDGRDIWDGTQWILYVPVPDPDPIDKLKDFLAENPDVMTMIS